MQQLREHYERQDTEELLELVGKDLTEEARAVLNQVLGSRGVGTESISAVRVQAERRDEVKNEAERRLAPRSMRLIAFLIDFVGVSIAVHLVLLPLRFISPEVHENTAISLWLAYFLFRDSIPGQSLGKRMAKIRVERTDTGKACGWSASLWRNLTHAFFVLDALCILGRRRMRFGDMLAGTQVVNSAAAS